MNNKKFAIYGGSFDPIHLAHVTLADYAVKEVGLDELYFMPAYVSPFKQDRKVTDGKMRYEMVQTVLDYNKAFKASDYELKQEGLSYTINTLKYWQDRNGGKLYFLLGLDSLIDLDQWYQGKEILKNYSIITDKCRPGFSEEKGNLKLAEYREKYNSDIHVLSMPPMDVSSTKIRNRAKEGKNLKGMVLPKTEEYIFEHKLYK